VVGGWGGGYITGITVTTDSRAISKLSIMKSGYQRKRRLKKQHT